MSHPRLQEKVGCGHPQGVLVPMGRERGSRFSWLRERGGGREGAARRWGRRRASGLQVCGLGASWMHSQAEIYNDISGVDVQTSSPTHRHKSETPDSIGRSRQPAAPPDTDHLQTPSFLHNLPRQTDPWSHHQHVLTHAHTLVFPKVL